MGGKAEDTIQSPGKSKLGKGGTIQGASPTPSEPIQRVAQELRFHESGGEVHFHDDSDKRLKCAIPVAEWFSAWNKLKSLQIQNWQYLDQKRGTLLKVTVGKADDGKLDASVTLTKEFDDTSPGPVYEALEKFTFSPKK